jgi:phage portal protein BeeE
MGFAATLNASGKDKTSDFPKLGKPGKSSWREVFGSNTRDKEEGYVKVPSDGGSYGRSNVSTAASFKRLLEAMRSQSPGGWTDDRWEQSKRFADIVYVAIHRQNELLTQAEFQVFEKDDNAPEGKVPARSSGARELIDLLEKPNKDEGFGDLLSMWNLQMDLTGSALTWMVPNALGKPYELYPVPTAMAIPQPVLNPEFPNGFYRIQPLYPYGPFSSYPVPSSAVGAPIPAEWMMRFKYPHPLLRYEGYSPLTALRLPLDQVSSIDRSRMYSMKRNINPSATLSFEEMESPQPLPTSEIERLVAEFENAHEGPENHGKLYVAPPGSKLEPWGARPVDMDYQSGWDQLVGFAMSGLGITKSAAGMVDDTAYATLFASLKQLYWLTLDPKVSRIARKLTRFLAPFFGDNLIIEIRCKRIDDHEIKFGRIDRAMQAKCVTKNEVRQELDFPATKEEWGEEIAGHEEQEQQQGQQGVAGLAEGQGSNNDPNGGGGISSFFDGAEEEDKETEEQRPDPGTLNEGSLGPRMGTVKSKSFYNRLQKVLSNGHSAA